MSAADALPTPQLEIRLLGGFHAVYRGVELTDFGRSKARALLAYLALECGRDHDRRTLTALFWPDLPQDQGMVVLRQVLYTLSRQLDTGNGPPLLQISRQSVRLERNGLRVDVHELLERCAQLKAHTHRGLDRCAVCAPQLAGLFEQSADSSLWVGRHDSPGLEQNYTVWQGRVEAAGHAIAAAYLARLLRHRRWHEAEAAARRRLSAHPWEEMTVRSLMTALSRRGERSAALRIFRRAETEIQRELGYAPEPATRELAALIAADRLPALAAPHAPPPLIGRERLLDELEQLLALPATRLITLLGIGGSGKSTLAQALAQRCAAEYNDGCVVVAVNELRDPDEVLQRLAFQIGIDAGRAEQPAAAVAQELRRRDLLVVLDECERLTGLSRLVANLLAAVPQLQLLCTSRTPLMLNDEHLIRVDGLTLPLPEAEIGELRQNAAVMLFMRQAERLLPPSERDETLLVHAARICRAVDGIPLAVLLAAAQLRRVMPAVLADQLEQSTGPLTAAMADLPERHQNLPAIIEESFARLNRSAQLLLLCAARFSSSFSHDLLSAPAEALGVGISEELSTLLDSSLLQFGPDGRLRMHTLVRKTLLPHLAAAAEYAVIDQAYRRTVLLQTAAQITRLRRSLSHVPEVSAGIPELRSAWQSAISAGDLALLQQFTRPTFELLVLLGAFETARELAETTLAAGNDAACSVQTGLRAQLEGELARVLHYLGDDSALAAAERAVQAAERSGERIEQIAALANRARIRLHRGDLDAAEADAIAGSTLAAQHGLTARVRALPEFFAAAATACRGDFTQAQVQFRLVAGHALEGGFNWAAGDALAFAAVAELACGEPTAAVASLRLAGTRYFPDVTQRPVWMELLTSSFDIIDGLRPVESSAAFGALTTQAGWEIAQTAQTAPMAMVTGMVLLWCGLPAAALPVFALAEQMTRTDHSLWGRIAIRIQRSYAELAIGRQPDRTELQRALQAVEAAHDPRNAAQLHRLLALLAADDRPDEARFHLERAIAAFARAGYADAAYACHAQLAQLAAATGDLRTAAASAAQLERLPTPFWFGHDHAAAVLTAVTLPAEIRPVGHSALRRGASEAIQRFAQHLPDGLRRTFLARPSHQALLREDG